MLLAKNSSLRSLTIQETGLSDYHIREIIVSVRKHSSIQAVSFIGEKLGGSPGLKLLCSCVKNHNKQLGGKSHGWFVVLIDRVIEKII